MELGNNRFTFPAVGYADSGQYTVGSYGSYWSSSLYEGAPSNAWNLNFNPNNAGVNNNNRYYGQSVRGVCGGSVQILPQHLLFLFYYKLYGIQIKSETVII